MFKKVLIFVFISLLAQEVWAVSPKYVHKLVPGFEFGGVSFGGLDMDSQSEGIQESVRADPSSVLSANIKWKWKSACPNCLVHVNAFGDWTSAEELARLFSGVKGSEGSIDSTISFLTPNEPENYTLRVIFLFDQKKPSPDFNATGVCAEYIGECHILLAEGLVEVAALASNDTVPPSVRITSPLVTSPSGIIEIDLGEMLLIDASVSDPLASVSIRISDQEIPNFPYLWNTSNVSEGIYKITVLAKDSAGLTGEDEVLVAILNRTKIETLQLLWMREEKKPISSFAMTARGDKIFYASNNLLYAFGRDGSEFGKYSFNDSISSVAVSADGGLAIVASGMNVHILDTLNKTLSWSFTAPGIISDLASSSDGVVVAIASENKVFFLRNNTILWSFTAPAITSGLTVSTDGALAAVASGVGVHVLDIFGKTIVWSFTAPSIISSLASSSDGRLIVAGLDGEIILLSVENKSIAWRFTTGGAVRSIGVDSNATSIVVGTDSRIQLLRDQLEVWSRPTADLNSVAMTPSSDLLAYAQGNKIFIYEIPRPAPPPVTPTPTEKARRYILLLPLVLVVLVIVYRRRISQMILARQPYRREEVAAEIKPVEEYVELHIRIRNQAGENVPNASVRIDEIEKISDKGGAVSSRLSPGEYGLTIKKPLYETYERKYTVSQTGATIELNLLSTLRLSTREIDVLNSLKELLSKSFEEVAAHDRCLPNYYLSIGNGVVSFVEALPMNPEHFIAKPDSYEVLLKATLELAEEVCSDLREVITDWRNVEIYKASRDLRTNECKAGEFGYEIAKQLASITSDPEGYSKGNFAYAKNRLIDVDKVLSGKIGELTILPITGLWNISRKLMDDAAVSGGYRGALCIAMALRILKYAEEMMEKPSILDRLKRTII